MNIVLGGKAEILWLKERHDFINMNTNGSLNKFQLLCLVTTDENIGLLSLGSGNSQWRR